MASVTVCDVLASAIGAHAAPSHSAYQLTSGAYDTAAAVVTAVALQLDNDGEDTGGGDDGDPFDCTIFFMSST